MELHLDIPLQMQPQSPSDHREIGLYSKIAQTGYQKGKLVFPFGH